MKPSGPAKAWDGIILRVRRQGLGQVLTVFTKQQGLASVFVRRSRSRQGFGAFFPFSEMTFDAVSEKEALSLREYGCRTNEAMMNLTWDSYVYSQIFADMVLCLMPYGQPDPGVYSLLLRYSRFLARKDPRVVTIIAGWQLAALAGFYPDTAHIRVFAGPEKGRRRFYFGGSPEEMLPEWPVPQDIRALWQILLSYRWEREETVRLSAGGLAVLEQLLYSYVEQCGEKPLKSLLLLDT